MTKTTFTAEQVTAAKDIARADVKVWHAASLIGPALAKIDADDQNARKAFWSDLAATMSYGPHKAYWTLNASSGRRNVTDWATAYTVCQTKGVDPKLMFSGGKVPTVASVKALITGRDSLDGAKLTAELTGKNAKPFGLPAVQAALPTIARGANTKTKTTKADGETKKANDAAIAEAKAEAAAIVSEAANDAKANTLASMVDFIGREADAKMIKAIRAACDQAASRLATVDAMA